MLTVWPRLELRLVLQCYIHKINRKSPKFKTLQQLQEHYIAQKSLIFNHYVTYYFNFTFRQLFHVALVPFSVFPIIYESKRVTFAPLVLWSAVFLEHSGVNETLEAAVGSDHGKHSLARFKNKDDNNYTVKEHKD